MLKTNNYIILIFLILISTIIFATNIKMHWGSDSEYRDDILIAIDYELNQTNKPDPNTGIIWLKILERKEVMVNGIKNEDFGSMTPWTVKLEPNFVEDPNYFGISFHRFEILY